MNLDELTSLAPKFHIRAGEPISWQLSDPALKFIYDSVDANSTTLETGEGMSTVVFAMKGARHRCVSPNETSIKLIEVFCATHSISMAKVTFATKRSDEDLPCAELDQLDFVLIDGGHGFPIPFIDWFYSASALKRGGTVLIDDTHLWTAATLRDFLLVEPGWRLLNTFDRSVAFERLDDARVGTEWTDQPYVASRSALSQVPQPRLLARFRHHLTRERPSKP